MKNFNHAKKALSPVVATIIIVAVTITVTLATCGWLSTLPGRYGGTTAITVNDVQFTGTSGQSTNVMVLSLKNTGTQQVTIEMIRVNEMKFTFTDQNTTYAPTEAKNLVINDIGWQPGFTYNIQIIGNTAQTVGAYQTTALGA